MDAERLNPIVVGFESHNYGGARNTYADVPGVEHRKVRRIPFSLIGPLHARGFDRAFVPLGPTNCDLLHLWNRTSFGTAPWGASFESLYPYFEASEHPQWMRATIPRIVSDRCRFLVPISDYALRSLQSNIGPDLWSTIEHKVHVVPPFHEIPPKPPIRTAPKENEPLRLLFVGVTFFGKGGEAVLDVVEALGDELNLELTVVSPVTGTDYDGTPPASTDVAAVRRRLTDNPRITWTERVTHAEVLALMASHDLGLLPTLADTYGYVVLEFMGLAVPTIVTNVQALPSFTGKDTGWTIDLATDERGLWVGRQPGIEHRAHCYDEAIGRLRAGLTTTLTSIRNDPDQLVHRSASARERLEHQFDPVRRSSLMRRIYEGAL